MSTEYMTPEQIMADMEAFDKEVVPEKVHPALTAKKDLPGRSPTSSTGPVQEGEASAEETGTETGEVADAEPKPTEEVEDAAPKETADRKRDPATGKFLKEEALSAEVTADTDKEVQTEADAGQELSGGDAVSATDTKNQRAQKEKARQESLLKNFEEEKARERANNAAEKAEIARERERIRLEELERRQSVGQRPKDEYGNEIYSSAELRKAALQYRDLAFKGETGPNGEDYADWSRKAEQAATQAVQRETKEAQELFERRQTNMAMETMAANPELSDPNSALAQELQEVFRQELAISQAKKRGSVFKMIEDGFGQAVEIAKLRTKASGYDAEVQKNTTLQAEIDRLNKLNKLGSSQPTKPPVTKTAENMTADEGLAEMDKVAIKQGAKLFL